MRTVQTDVLIVGSGFGAAAPALRLAEAGLAVTVIEKGPALDPWKDFRQTQDPRYVLRYLKSMIGDNLSFTYAEALGGGSGFYEMVSLRAPTTAFAQIDQSGGRLWPAGVDRAELDPHYDLAEQMLRVEQIKPELVPKSGLVFARMMKNLGYSCERARYAVQHCMGSGFCVTGCIYGAKQSLLLNYLPQAGAAGATVETGLEALEIHSVGRVQETSGGGSIANVPFRYDVLCRRTATGEIVRFRAKLLVLAAGTVGTAKLLLRSRRHLAFLSDQVGRHIAFNGSVKVAGVLPDRFPHGDMFVGRSHAGMISYEFLASHGISISAAKPLPLQAVAAAQLRLEGDQRTPWQWGQANVELMRKFRHRVIVLVTLGMTPPLGAIVPNAGGGFDVTLPLADELRRYHREVQDILRHLMVGNGLTPIEASFVNHDGEPYGDLHFSTAHHVGSCRMADTKARGGVDASGQVFDYPGLYVSDGAAIPSSLAVNTSLTILANAERIAAGIAERYAPAREMIAATSGSSD